MNDSIRMLVCCAEWVDNNGKASNIILPSSANFSPEFTIDLLNGVVILKTTAPTIQVANDGTTVSTINKPITLIPYYAWANRGAGEMMIWFPSTVKDIDLIAAQNTTATQPK